MLEVVAQDADRDRRATGPAQHSQARQQSVARRPTADREGRRDRNARGIAPLCLQPRDCDVLLLAQQASRGRQARSVPGMRQHEERRPQSKHNPDCQ